MYSYAAFYLEIQTNHIPGDGWDASATFSRRSDYRGYANVTKTRFNTHVTSTTKEEAIRETLRWARKFIDSSANVIESALRLQEKFKNFPAPL